MQRAFNDVISRIFKELLDEENVSNTDNQQNPIIIRFSDARQVDKDFEVPILSMAEIRQ